jgi:hypothetical protein
VAQRGEPGASTFSHEQWSTEPLFQCFHLIRDGGLRQPELGRGSGETLIAGCGFEGPNGSKGWQASHPFT